MKNKKSNKVKMDIRKHRFVPTIKTASKIFIDKKRKAKTRRELNKMAKDYNLA